MTGEIQGKLHKNGMISDNKIKRTKPRFEHRYNKSNEEWKNIEYHQQCERNVQKRKRINRQKGM